MSETGPRFFLCIRNEGYAASLHIGTVYRALDDSEAESHGMLRIVDESGESYLFPASFFGPVDLPEAQGWESATWKGARREQMRRWAALPLEEIVAAQEEMAELAERLANTPPKRPEGGS
jgi:hypothetical protein